MIKKLIKYLNSKFKNNKLFLVTQMNKLYSLPVNTVPTLATDKEERIKKLENFKKILIKEINEIDDIINKIKNNDNIEDLEILTDIADLLGDFIIYSYSESIKYGLSIDTVMRIIMESNMSKLGADGKPIIDEDGKVGKGPNYYRPEDKIYSLLKSICDKSKQNKKTSYKSIFNRINNVF